jgi:hypothetical protein
MCNSTVVTHPILQPQIFAFALSTIRQTMTFNNILTPETPHMRASSVEEASVTGNHLMAAKTKWWTLNNLWHD